MNSEPTYAGLIQVAAQTALSLMQEHGAVDFLISSGSDPMIITVGAHVRVDEDRARRIVAELNDKAAEDGYELNASIGPVAESKGRALAFTVVPAPNRPRAR
jgi:hypothetical protein